MMYCQSTDPKWWITILPLRSSDFRFTHTMLFKAQYSNYFHLGFFSREVSTDKLCQHYRRPCLQVTQAFWKLTLNLILKTLLMQLYSSLITVQAWPFLKTWIPWWLQFPQLQSSEGRSSARPYRQARRRAVQGKGTTHIWTHLQGSTCRSSTRPLQSRGLSLWCCLPQVYSMNKRCTYSLRPQVQFSQAFPAFTVSSSPQNFWMTSPFEVSSFINSSSLMIFTGSLKTIVNRYDTYSSSGNSGLESSPRVSLLSRSVHLDSL